MAKRFENEKLHEFVIKRFSLLKGGYGLWNNAKNILSVASEEDIAGYLQDELKISSFSTNWDATKWTAYHTTTGHIPNNSRTQAIFDCAEEYWRT